MSSFNLMITLATVTPHVVTRLMEVSICAASLNQYALCAIVAVVTLLMREAHSALDAVLKEECCTRATHARETFGTVRELLMALSCAAKEAEPFFIIFISLNFSNH